MLVSTRRGQARGTHEHLPILVHMRAPPHNDSQHETTSWITNIGRPCQIKGSDTGGIQIGGISEQKILMFSHPVSFDVTSLHIASLWNEKMRKERTVSQVIEVCLDRSFKFLTFFPFYSDIWVHVQVIAGMYINTFYQNASLGPL